MLMNDWRSRPISTACANPAASIARFSISFVGAMTSGSTRARRSARASTSAARRSAGTTRLTRPIRSASAGVDQVAGQQQLAGLLLADDERHEQRHRRRAEPDLGLAEPGVLRGHDQVAGHRQLEPAGQRVAVDLGDDRLRAWTDRERRRHVAAEHVAPAQRGRGLLLGQVVAGAERPTGAGDRDDPDALVGGGVGDRGGQLVAQLRVERVQLVGTVERQPDAPRRRVAQDERLAGHGAARTTRASTATAPTGRRSAG